MIHKICLLHDECLTFYPTKDLDLVVNRLMSHWSLPHVGTVKVNVDGSFLDGTSHLGAGGVVRGADGNWVISFTHFKDAGDVLLAKLLAILLGINLCYNLGYKDFVCECDCLEAVSLISCRDAHNLHCYASILMYITGMMDFCGAV